MGRKARIAVLLGSVWFVASLPLPWLVNNPAVSEGQLLTVLGLVAVISVPFVGLGVAWTLRPQLAG